MKNFTQISLLLIAQITLCNSAFAQEGITLRDGKQIPIEQTHFDIRPTNCPDDLCVRRPITILKDICIYARCNQIDPRAIPEILGVDALHWRVNRANKTMTQFMGDRQLGNAIKTSIPPLLAAPEEVKALPIIGIKNSAGQVTQYWVWTN